MTSFPINAPVVAYLSKLKYRANAARQVCLIPLCGLYWEDEMSEPIELFRLSEVDRLQIFRLFAIRYKFWDGEALSEEERLLWDSVRSQVPNAPIFQRLALSPADKLAHEEARQSCEREFEQFLADADKVTLTDDGSGIQTFSATFDLTERNQIEAKKQPWWKRLLSF